MENNITSFDSFKKLSQTEKTFYMSSTTATVLDNGEVASKHNQGAEVITVNIRGLTAAEVTKSEEILDAAIAPRIMEEVQAERMGTKQIFTGSYDFEDPTYLRQLERLKTRRTAYICLAACKNFSDTPGETVDEKIDSILDNISFDVLATINEQIYAISIGTAADKTAFFLNEDSNKEDSESSPDSTPIPPKATQK